MEALEAMSRNMGTFVRFFDNINRLFCQIRWLEQNINNSSLQLLIFVGAIIFLCYFIFAAPTDSSNPFAAITKAINDYGPIVVVVALIAYFIARRMSGVADAEGTEAHGSLDSVLFGNSRSGSGGHHARDNRGNYEMVSPTQGADIENRQHYSRADNILPVSPSAPPMFSRR